MLGGFPQAFAPGTDFAYCNGGFVVLALLAERAAGVPFHDLVQRHVIDRAGLTRTAYLRSDALPGDAALGYLHPGATRTSCAPTCFTCRSSAVATAASSPRPPTC